MSEFAITTDNTADLPQSFVAENNIGMMLLSYSIDDVTYSADLGTEMSTKEFYNKMRNGALPKTQQINPEQAIEKLRPLLQEGKDVLHISLSSALSGSFNSVEMAARELKEEFPERTVIVVDSLLGSLAQGFVVMEAVKLRKQGKTVQETAQALQEFLPRVKLYATVDDLKHLYRGGRLSKTAALLGTAIGMKPMLWLKEGKLQAIGKVRGRKQSIQELVKYIQKEIGDKLQEDAVVCISHGDCEEEANMLVDMIREKLNGKHFILSNIGPVIASHAGPGAIAVSFLK